MGSVPGTHVIETMIVNPIMSASKGNAQSETVTIQEETGANQAMIVTWDKNAYLKETFAAEIETAKDTKNVSRKGAETSALTKGIANPMNCANKVLVNRPFVTETVTVKATLDA